MTSETRQPAAEKRGYRKRAVVARLIPFQVSVQETDLMVQADKDLTQICREEIMVHRGYIEQYIRRFPEFATTLTPWQQDGPAPEIIASSWAPTNRALFTRRSRSFSSMR